MDQNLSYLGDEAHPNVSVVIWKAKVFTRIRLGWPTWAPSQEALAVAKAELDRMDPRSCRSQKTSRKRFGHGSKVFHHLKPTELVAHVSPTRH